MPALGEKSKGAQPATSDLVEARLREALHEIRQPLSAVFALTECVRLTPDLPEATYRYLDRLVEEAVEVADAAASALDTSADADGVVVLRCDEVLDSVLASFALTWTGRLVRRGYRGSVSVLGRRGVLRRCLVNLLDNATRAAGMDGTVMVTVHRGHDRVRVLVDDDGPGFGRIPPGASLGLKITRRSLEHVGGYLAVGLRSRLGGARAVLSLPIAPDESSLPMAARAG